MGNEVYIESIFKKAAGVLRSPLHGQDEQFLALFKDAIEYYWEQDLAQRFTQIITPQKASSATQDHYFGLHFWDLDTDVNSNVAVWAEYKQHFHRRQDIQNLVFCRKLKGNELGYFSINAKPNFGLDGQFSGYCGVVVDVSSQQSKNNYLTTIEHAAIGIAQVDSNGCFIFTNKKLCEILGYSRDELLYMHADDLSFEADKNMVQNLWKNQKEADRKPSIQIEKRYKRKDGELIWVRLTVTRIYEDTEGKDHFDISVVEDITEKVLAQENFRYLATHDELTALPNRMLFTHLLRYSIELAMRNRGQVAVLMIDLDRFKYIIDSLGHAAGDYVLQEMGERFKNALRSSDVVARLGGDEFAILLQNVNGEESVAIIANKILEVAREPIKLLQHECCITTSIGISIFPEDGDDDVSIMRKADKALYLAKDEGKNNYQFSLKEADGASTERIQMETLLNRAIENCELCLHYQPKVQISSGRIVGAEALLRWQSPVLGNVPPGQFIPLVEELELIIPIGRWVIEQACAQFKIWLQQGLPVKTVSVNLSPRQFSDPGLIKFIKNSLESSGLPGGVLELEITEGVVMQKPDKALKILEAIKTLGVRVAIDDFGTGYSSLGQLKRFPVDTLKIDRSFIKDLEVEAQDRAITRAVITMGKALGLSVVAEGVETAAQAKFLAEHGCDEIQGYFYGRPSKAEEFEALVSKFSGV